ncbi:MAG: hypothetical protein IT366_23970 [Candidatus Hydrogenedentes bacterium]|nr:hypothetical protein [Candidatus Hydrogenedentota bacterium]
MGISELLLSKSDSKSARITDVSDPELAQAVVRVLRFRPNNSIKRDALAKDVLEVIGVVIRGTPRKQFDGRLTKLLYRLDRAGIVELYASKNPRVRLSRNHEYNYERWSKHQHPRPGRGTSLSEEHTDSKQFELDVDTEIFSVPDLDEPTDEKNGHLETDSSEAIPNRFAGNFAYCESAHERFEELLSQKNLAEPDERLSMRDTAVPFCIKDLKVALSHTDEFEIDVISTTLLRIKADGLIVQIEHSTTFRTLTYRATFPYDPHELSRFLHDLPRMRAFGALGLVRHNGVEAAVYFAQIDVERYKSDEITDLVRRFISDALLTRDKLERHHG